MKQTSRLTLWKLEDAVGDIKEAQVDLEKAKALSPDMVDEFDTIIARLEALLIKVRCKGSSGSI